MVESSRSEEENIIKDARNLFRLNKLKKKKKQMVLQLRV